MASAPDHPDKPGASVSQQAKDLERVRWIEERRVADLNAPDPQGEAALARPRVTTERKLRISATRTERIVETRVPTLLHDRMHYHGQLWDRHYTVACRLYTLWTIGGFERPTSASYAPRSGDLGWGETLDETADEQAPYRQVTAQLWPESARMIDALMLGQEHPGRELARLQAALEEAEPVLDAREGEDEA